MDIIMRINQQVSAFVWGPAMVALMLGTGIYLSIFTRFFQVTKFGRILHNTLGSLFQKRTHERSYGTISPFQAVSTALAGTIGTGNIAGVATAIVAGGPGAIFWMWVSGLFGMITKYAEVVLAVRYRSINKEGGFSGGPMYYIEKGLGMKWLAALFALLCVFASFGIGNIAQSNSIADALQTATGIPPLYSGIAVALVCGVVLIGGAQRIAKVTEFVVPFMAAFYLIGSLIFLMVNADGIPRAFSLIFSNAFQLQSAVGGAAGYTIKKAVHFGVSRGIFTNEAGLGSAPIAHASSSCKSPVEQGMWGIFEVFFDTIVICTITTLVILTADGGTLWQCGLDGASLTTAAFSTVFGKSGSIFLSVAVVFFAVASILGWAFYGQKSIAYLTHENDRVLLIYRMIFILLIVGGAVMHLEAAWSISDTLNGLMALPNLAALLVLSPVVFKLTREYREGSAAGRRQQKLERQKKK